MEGKQQQGDLECVTPAQWPQARGLGDPLCAQKTTLAIQSHDNNGSALATT